jgi:hypothetical protein
MQCVRGYFIKILISLSAAAALSACAHYSTDIALISAERIMPPGMHPLLVRQADAYPPGQEFVRIRLAASNPEAVEEWKTKRMTNGMMQIASCAHPAFYAQSAFVRFDKDSDQFEAVFPAGLGLLRAGYLPDGHGWPASIGSEICVTFAAMPIQHPNGVSLDVTPVSLGQKSGLFDADARSTELDVLYRYDLVNGLPRCRDVKDFRPWCQPN